MTERLFSMWLVDKLKELFAAEKPKRTKRGGQKTWQDTEKAACARRGKQHHGGPGKQDCGEVGDSTEVKDWSTPITSTVVRKSVKRGDKEIVARSGATKPAKDLARKHGIKISKR